MMKPLHPWKVTPEQAIRIQENLRHRMILKKTFSRVRMIGGADVSYPKGRNFLFGAVVILSFPEMETLDVATAYGEVSFPYLPGLLTFREGPVLIRAFQKLRRRPEVLIFDGHGVAHPREMGLATHLGIYLNLPSIGCAKTPLLSGYPVPGSAKGDYELILKDGQEVGAVLRTKDGVKPLFVSPGHRIDLWTSIQLVLDACRGFRIPEPLRRAHQISRLLLQRI
ncbi:MAG: endonuclease V [Thermodesulfobacteriota bacterium]